MVDGSLKLRLGEIFSVQSIDLSVQIAYKTLTLTADRWILRKVAEKIDRKIITSNIPVVSRRNRKIKAFEAY